MKRKPTRKKAKRRRKTKPRQKAKPRSALLIIDVINDLEFPGGDKVLPWAKRAVDSLTDVAKRARNANVPVIYVNDNFGHWRSNFDDVYKHCTRTEARGRNTSRALKPQSEDYFVLKPKHSAFYATSLVPLLEHLEVDHLILAGMATNLCVLFSAYDAHMHEYDLTILSDCCAAESDADHNWALGQLRQFLKATICRGDELFFGK